MSFETFKRMLNSYNYCRTMWRKSTVNSPEFLKYDDLKYEYEQIVYEEVNRLLIKISIYTSLDGKVGMKVKEGLEIFDSYLKEYNKALDICQSGKNLLWNVESVDELSCDYVNVCYDNLIKYVESLYNKVEV